MSVLPRFVFIVLAAVVVGYAGLWAAEELWVLPNNRSADSGAASGAGIQRETFAFLVITPAAATAGGCLAFALTKRRTG